MAQRGEKMERSITVVAPPLEEEQKKALVDFLRKQDAAPGYQLILEKKEENSEKVYK